MRAGEVAQRQRISRDVEADGFHGADAAQRAHLRAVEHGRAEGFVVGDGRADAFLLQQGRDFLHRVEELRNRRAGVAGQEMSSPLRFQCALD